MEDTSNVKNQQSSATPSVQASSNGKSSKLLRYPLRSGGSKSKQDKSPPETLNSSSSSAHKRGRSASSLSRSVSVLDLSGKEKSASKPPRRLSIPTKPSASPHQKAISTITPIPEASMRRPVNGQGNNETPCSDVSRSSAARRRFCALSSASYWLNQIKLAESAAKHSISLGFFKLALEAGCEPLHLLRDGLKRYVRKHNLAALGETAKALLESYDISEALEQLQVSETCSQVTGEGSPSSNEAAHSSSSSAGMRSLKPKSLNIDATLPSSVKEPSKKYNAQKNTPVAKIRGSVTKTSVKPKSTAGGVGNNNFSKKAEKAKKQESATGLKTHGIEPASEVSVKPLDMGCLEEEKENQDVPQMGAVVTN